jgi:hypothetical protein
MQYSWLRHAVVHYWYCTPYKPPPPMGKIIDDEREGDQLGEESKARVD